MLRAIRFLVSPKYGTTIADIKKVNGLTSDNIRVGQKLKTSSSQAVVAKPTASLFKKMWDNFPFSNVIHKVEEMDNYRAVNLSEALIKSNIAVSGGNCWGCPTRKNNTHYLRAEEMAEWLKKEPFQDCPTPIKATGKTFKEQFRNKKVLFILRIIGKEPMRKEQAKERVIT